MLNTVLRHSCVQLALKRSIHSSTTCLAGGRWRARQGESSNPNEYGPLVDVPDWSYLDGTPAPLSHGEVLRRERYRQLGKRALKAMEELNMAKEMYKKKQQIQQEHNERILPRFKPKVQR